MRRMLKIDPAEIRRRLGIDNPWWSDTYARPLEGRYERRAYFDSFKALALDLSIQRATVLLGPRRVGKTVMVKQLISDALDAGFDSDKVLYASIDTPIYFGMSLEQILGLFPEATKEASRLVVFDEIQYLSSWEVHLKDLVDRHPNIKFVVTGSAAASLRLRSRESGAGRFSEFMLPPLTFHEFLLFAKAKNVVRQRNLEKHDGWFAADDIEKLNNCFIDYLNYGGYPEAVLNETIRANPEQFIKSDIIDKVLLKDLPNLYGISNIPELNRLFSVLAYNTGNEASLENIAQDSEMEKSTIKRYIAYLESAFLIIKLSPVDQNCRSFKRERTFKIYLNNPSMRAALFGPIKPDETKQIGHLAEAAIVSQWQHAPDFNQLRYSKLGKAGEVDLVYLDRAKQRPSWMGEVKWSDRIQSNETEVTRSMRALWRKNPKIGSAIITTRTINGKIDIDGHEVPLCPSALYCYTVGRNLTSRSRLGLVDTAAPRRRGQND